MPGISQFFAYVSRLFSFEEALQRVQVSFVCDVVIFWYCRRRSYRLTGELSRCRALSWFCYDTLKPPATPFFNQEGCCTSWALPFRARLIGLDTHRTIT